MGVVVQIYIKIAYIVSFSVIFLQAKLCPTRTENKMQDVVSPARRTGQPMPREVEQGGNNQMRGTQQL